MKRLSCLALSVVAMTAMAGGVQGQPRQDQRFQQHPEQRQDVRPEQRQEQRPGDRHDWQRGEQVDRESWDRGGRIDYRRNHLRPPPRGYEWREVNGTYILGAIATGIIADILINGQR